MSGVDPRMWKKWDKYRNYHHYSEEDSYAPCDYSSSSSQSGTISYSSSSRESYSPYDSQDSRISHNPHPNTSDQSLCMSPASTESGYATDDIGYSGSCGPQYEGASPHHSNYKSLPNDFNEISLDDRPDAALIDGYKSGDYQGIGKKSSKPRQNYQARSFYEGLSEEEKRERTRQLNNEASRKYRQRKKQQCQVLEEEEKMLLSQNRKLRSEMERLEDFKKKLERKFLGKETTA